MIIRNRKPARVGIDTVEKPALRIKNRRSTKRSQRGAHDRTAETLFLPHRLHI